MNAPSITPALKPLARLLGLLGLCSVLGSCGGGGVAAVLNSAGVGSGGTGVVQGLVTGFGSVFIDGTEYLTSTSTTVDQEDSAGQAVTALLKLGDRVQATLDASGNATAVTVLPALSGPLTLAPVLDATTGDWWGQVDGQWVRIVTTAANTPLGITTVLSGCTLVNPNFSATAPIASCLGQMSPGNEVEAHGTWVLDSVHNAWILVASRLEITATSPSATAPVHLGGIVTSIAAAASQVTLNAGAGASSGGITLQGVLPNTLATGQTLSAWVARNAWNNSGMGQSIVPASAITNTSLSANASGQSVAQLSGLISNYNPTNNTALVQGTLVAFPGSYQGNIGDGDYVRVTGALSGNGLNAAALYPSHQTEDHVVTLSNAASNTQSMEIKGITNNWAGPVVQTFTLQGTAISTTTSTQYTGCSGLNSGALVSLDVLGTSAPGQPVTASSIQCSPPPGSGSNSDSVTDLRGTISNLSAGAGSGTLTLTLGNEAGTVYTVNWTPNTFIDPNLLDPATGNLLVTNGQSLDIIGVLSNGVLNATALRPYQPGAKDHNATND